MSKFKESDVIIGNGIKFKVVKIEMTYNEYYPNDNYYYVVSHVVRGNTIVERWGKDYIEYYFKLDIPLTRDTKLKDIGI